MLRLIVCSLFLSGGWITMRNIAYVSAGACNTVFRKAYRRLTLDLYGLDRASTRKFTHICHAYDTSCFATNYTKYSCKRRVMIVIDSTPPAQSTLRNVEFLTATAIIQRLDIREDALSVGLATYERLLREKGSEVVLKELHVQLDVQVTEGINVVVHETRKPENHRSIENIFKNPGLDDSTLITVTTDSNQYDVDAARELIEEYIRKKKVWNFSSVVINLGSSIFHDWLRHSNVYNEYPHEALNKMDNMTEFVNLAVCGGHGINNKRTTTATTPKPTGTTATTKLEPTTGTTKVVVKDTTGPISTTATKSSAKPTSTIVVKSTTEPTLSTLSPLRPTRCSCSPKTVWLDVFVLLDASVHMTPNGVESATDYVVSAFSKLTIGQEEMFQTRLGVISYASNVKLIADLNLYTSNTDLSDLDIPMMEEAGTNIEGAIRLATSKYSSSSHRASRPVLVIIGNSYRDGQYNDPTQIAQEFRENGGIIITIEYVQNQGLTVPMLRTLASPNYILTNKKSDGSELRSEDLYQLLCEANCFCKRNWNPYKTNKWNAPYAGCYYKSSANAVQKMANRRCQKWSAALMLDEDSSKDELLINAFPENASFWLGLQYKDNKWAWPNGKPVGFTKWAPGQPNYKVGNCAYMKLYPGSKSAWFTDNCMNDHKYICQAKACDSTTYCPAK